MTKEELIQRMKDMQMDLHYVISLGESKSIEELLSLWEDFDNRNRPRRSMPR